MTENSDWGLLFPDYSICDMVKATILTLALIMLMAFLPSEHALQIDDQTSLAEVQSNLGMDFSAKKPKLGIKGVSARVGEDIVKQGFSKRQGEKKSKRQSKHFVCTSCHNLEREDPNLAFPTPESRLSFTRDKGMPFLQATTLYGAINRESYYNGDYEKKYGELVKPARQDIREAVQLCALECAQGRKLKDWEMESIMAYLWEIDLKIGDLQMSELEISSIQSALDKPALHGEALKLLSAKYKKESDATFLLPPENRKEGVGLRGDPSNGKTIYENSCLHCHYQKRYSFLHLDNNSMSFEYLDRKADTYNAHSIYQVTRYGTYSKYGKMSYMPRYTKERLSDQQLADLRAYLAKRAMES